MHRSAKYAVLLASAVMAGALAVTAIAADAPRGRSGPMMGQGGMMGRMGQMMDHCSQMMGGGSTRPNEQWRRPSPPDKSTPEKKG